MQKITLALARTLHTASQETKVLTYETLIRLILEYAPIVWNLIRKNYIGKIGLKQTNKVCFICRRY